MNVQTVLALCALTVVQGFPLSYHKLIGQSGNQRTVSQTTYDTMGNIFRPSSELLRLPSLGAAEKNVPFSESDPFTEFDKLRSGSAISTDEAGPEPTPAFSNTINDPGNLILNSISGPVPTDLTPMVNSGFTTMAVETTTLLPMTTTMELDTTTTLGMPLATTLANIAVSQQPYMQGGNMPLAVDDSTSNDLSKWLTKLADNRPSDQVSINSSTPQFSQNLAVEIQARKLQEKISQLAAEQTNKIMNSLPQSQPTFDLRKPRDVFEDAPVPNPERLQSAILKSILPNMAEPSKPDLASGVHGFSKEVKSALDYTVIDPTYVLVAGQNVLKNIQYSSSGNYVMKVDLEGIDTLQISDIQAGICDIYNPGLAIEQQRDIITIAIDLSICNSNGRFFSGDSVEKLNSGLNIKLKFLNKNSHEKISKDAPPSTYENSQAPVATYSFTVQTSIRSDYFIEYKTLTAASRSGAMNKPTRNSFEDASSAAVLESIGEHGSFSYSTIDFTISSYEDEFFTKKETGHKVGQKHRGELSEHNTERFIELKPSNGFDSNTMLVMPEQCYLSFNDKKETNNLNLNSSPIPNSNWQLWDLTQDNAVCVDGLSYDLETGTWRYAIDYALQLQRMRESGYSTFATDLKMEALDATLTCKLKVCANVYGNTCSDVLQKCWYNGENILNEVREDSKASSPIFDGSMQQLL